MKHKKHGSICVKTLAAIVCIAFATGCTGFFEEAPLSDGLYLDYDFGDGAIRVTFYATDSDNFLAVLSSGYEESNPDSIPEHSKAIVDTRLKKENGAVYEAGILGPLWIAPSRIKDGANVYGDEIAEIMLWEGWDVGVIRANVGQGALQGEWYYDTVTGFLVGGKRATIMNADEGGTVYVLGDSNLKALFE